MHKCAKYIQIYVQGVYKKRSHPEYFCNGSEFRKTLKHVLIYFEGANFLGRCNFSDPQGVAVRGGRGFSNKNRCFLMAPPFLFDFLKVLKKIGKIVQTGSQYNNLGRNGRRSKLKADPFSKNHNSTLERSKDLKFGPKYVSTNVLLRKKYVISFFTSCHTVFSSDRGMKISCSTGYRISI